MPTGCTILESLLQSASPADFWSHVSPASLPRWNAQIFKLANAEHMLAPPASMQRQIAFKSFAQHSGQQLQTCFHQTDTDGTSQELEADAQSREHEGRHESESHGHTTTNDTDRPESDEQVVETGSPSGHHEQVGPSPETDEESLRAQREEHDRRPDSELEETESLPAQHGSGLETERELEAPLQDKTEELDREGEELQHTEDVTPSTHASSQELQDTEHLHEEGHSQHTHRDPLGSASDRALKLKETAEAHQDQLESGRGLLESAHEAHAHRLGGERPLSEESRRDLEEASFQELEREETAALENINDKVDQRLLDFEKHMEERIQRYAQLLKERQADELESSLHGEAMTGAKIRIPLSSTTNVVNLQATEPSGQTSNGVGSTHDKVQMWKERMDAALKHLANPSVKETQETPEQLIADLDKLLHSLGHPAHAHKEGDLETAQFQERPMSLSNGAGLMEMTGEAMHPGPHPSPSSIVEVLPSSTISGLRSSPSSLLEFM